MQNFKAVIFDMDGLLLDSERLALQAFKTTCDKFDLDDLTHVFIKCIGTNLEYVRSILKVELDGLVDVNEFRSAWDSLYLDESSLVPVKEGAKELLKHLQSMNIPIAIATSTQTARAKTKLTNSGLIEYFDIIIGGDQVEQSKPNPAIYLKAASALSVNPADCLALEDSSNGVKAAVAAGMTVVQIPDLVEPDEELLKMEHIVLGSLLDVPGYNYLG